MFLLHRLRQSTDVRPEDVLTHISKDVSRGRKIHGETRRGNRDTAWPEGQVQPFPKNCCPVSDYSNLVSAEPDLAATTAGAITIPIKARAIRTSCMGESPLWEFLRTSPHPDDRHNWKILKSHEDSVGNLS
jgi:hypothetical protein